MSNYYVFSSNYGFLTNFFKYWSWYHVKWAIFFSTNFTGHNTLYILGPKDQWSETRTRRLFLWRSTRRPIPFSSPFNGDSPVASSIARCDLSLPGSLSLKNNDYKQASGAGQTMISWSPDWLILPTLYIQIKHILIFITGTAGDNEAAIAMRELELA